jgi:hypothetical protein
MKTEEQKRPEKAKINEENSHDTKKAEIKEESNKLADISKEGEELKRLKLNNKCVFIIQLLSFSFSFLVIYFAQTISFDGEVARSISEDLFDNFNSGFFLSFSKCKNPYSNTNPSNDNPIEFGEWQGTVDGCIEKIGDKTNIKILEQGENCENKINKIPPQKIYSFKGITLCGLTRGSYYDLLYEGDIIKEKEECPPGKKSCGYIDTIKNKLCVKNRHPCPVSYIKISDRKPNEEINDLKEIKFDKINFYYSNNPYPNSTEIPYISNSFRIADSYICALPNLYYSQISLFKLDSFNKKYSTNCVLKDYSQKVTIDLMRYHKMDWVDNYELYDENKIITKIKNNNLTNYGYNVDLYKDHLIYLYTRMHYGFDKECLDKRNEKFNLDQLQLMHGRADKMFTWGLWITVLVSISGTGVLSNLFFFSTEKYKDYEILTKYIFIILPNVIDVIYSFIAMDYNSPYQDEMTCSDSVTNDEFNIMIYKIQASGKKIKYTFILLSIQICLNIISAIINLFDKCKNKKEKVE